MVLVKGGFFQEYFSKEWEIDAVKKVKWIKDLKEASKMKYRTTGIIEIGHRSLRRYEMVWESLEIEMWNKQLQQYWVPTWIISTTVFFLQLVFAAGVDSSKYFWFSLPCFLWTILPTHSHFVNLAFTGLLGYCYNVLSVFYASYLPLSSSFTIKKFIFLNRLHKAQIENI